MPGFLDSPHFADWQYEVANGDTRLGYEEWVEINRPKPPLTHDYNVAYVKGKDLSHEHVLVGDSGGLSAIYFAAHSRAMPGMIALETEHGFLYLDPDEKYAVFDD